MALSFSTNWKSKLLKRITLAADPRTLSFSPLNGAKLYIFSGAIPGSISTADTGTLLSPSAGITLATSNWNTVSGGRTTLKNPITATALATGTAGYFRIRTGDATVDDATSGAIMQGTVGALGSGADLILGSTSFTASSSFSINNLTLATPLTRGTLSISSGLATDITTFMLAGETGLVSLYNIAASNQTDKTFASMAMLAYSTSSGNGMQPYLNLKFLSGALPTNADQYVTNTFLNGGNNGTTETPLNIAPALYTFVTSGGNGSMGSLWASVTGTSASYSASLASQIYAGVANTQSYSLGSTVTLTGFVLSRSNNTYTGAPSAFQPLLMGTVGTASADMILSTVTPTYGGSVSIVDFPLGI